MTEDPPYRNTMSKVQTRLSVVEAANASLARALKDVLAHEQRRAKVHGYSDCACINFSRELERSYESGQCPHQLARKSLDSARVDPSLGARVLEAVEVRARVQRAAAEQLAWRRADQRYPAGTREVTQRHIDDAEAALNAAVAAWQEGKT